MHILRKVVNAVFAPILQEFTPVQNILDYQSKLALKNYFCATRVKQIDKNVFYFCILSQTELFINFRQNLQF